jgi:hypothetical protein
MWPVSWRVLSSRHQGGTFDLYGLTKAPGLTVIAREMRWPSPQQLWSMLGSPAGALQAAVGPLGDNALQCPPGADQSGSRAAAQQRATLSRQIADAL